METKRFLNKGILIAFAILILVSCQWNESPIFFEKARSIENSTEAVHNVDANDAQRVDTVSYEIFGDVRIKTSEYLYNLNDSPDCILGLGVQGFRGMLFVSKSASCTMIRLTTS